MNFNFFDLFWIFLAISSLQPVWQRRRIEAQRIQAIRELERQRKSRVILLIHRQESISLLGIPFRATFRSKIPNKFYERYALLLLILRSI